MTISISLHDFTRVNLGDYVSQEGNSSVRFYSKDWTGEESGSVDIWFPRALAEQIVAVVNEYSAMTAATAMAITKAAYDEANCATDSADNIGPYLPKKGN